VSLWISASFLIPRVRVGSWLVFEDRAAEDRAPLESDWRITVVALFQWVFEGGFAAWAQWAASEAEGRERGCSLRRLAAKEQGKEGVLFLSRSFPGAPPALTPSMLAVGTFGLLGVRPCVYQSLLVVEMTLCDR